MNTEKKWQQKLEDLEGAHQQEKEETIRAHRENMYKALEEARNRWQKVGHEGI